MLNPNIVSISDFEPSSTSPWNLGTGYARSSTDKNSGSWSVNVTGTNSGSNMYQTVNVVTNTNYVFSFWAKSTTTGIAAAILKISDWSSIAAVNTISNSKWTKYTLYFNSGSETSVL